MSGFDGDVKLATDFFGGNNDAYALAIESDGRIVAVGYAVNRTRTDFSAARYIGDMARVKFDYDGDARADISVFRPAVVGGTWYVMQSSTGRTDGGLLNVASDKIVPADYDGDGKNDLAVYRPSTNVWYVLRSTNGSFFALQFGFSTDIQTPADYDGDGKTDIAVFRPSNGVWYVLRSSNGSVSYTQFGLNGDVPTPSAYVQ